MADDLRRERSGARYPTWAALVLAGSLGACAGDGAVDAGSTGGVPPLDGGPTDVVEQPDAAPSPDATSPPDAAPPSDGAIDVSISPGVPALDDAGPDASR
jgi:hypothetical protein